MSMVGYGDYRYELDDSWPNIPEGWTSFFVVLLFFGGIIMFSLWIIGEYIGRLYLLMNSKPQYIIKDTTKK